MGARERRRSGRAAVVALALAVFDEACGPSMSLARRGAVIDIKTAGESLEVTTGASPAAAYFASLDIGVGIPGYRRTVRVQLDTGSSTMAIPLAFGISPSGTGVGCHSAQCSSGSGGCSNTCGGAFGDPLAIGQCQANPFCTHLDPSMCHDCCTADSLCFFSMRYGDGSGIAGGLHNDWVSVGDGTLGVRYTFGGITTMVGNFEPEQVDGILGIGYAELNCNPTCHPTFVTSLVQGNELPDVFALCLGGLDGRASSWEIGEVVDTKYSGTMHWLSVLEKSYYVVPRPRSIHVGDTEVTHCALGWRPGQADGCGDDTWGQVIIDSGSSELVLNAPLYAATMDLLGKQSPMVAGQTCMEFPDSYDPRASFPPLRFHFTDEDGVGFDLEITAEQYLLKNRDEDTPPGRTWLCIGIASSTSGRTILGDVLMQAVYSVFDRRPTPTSSAGRVGLAPVTECHATQPPSWSAPPSGVLGDDGLLEFLAAHPNSDTKPGSDAPAPPGQPLPAPDQLQLPQTDPGQNCVVVSGVRYCDAEDIIHGMAAHPERAAPGIVRHDAIVPTLEESHAAACSNSTLPAALRVGTGHVERLNFFSDLHYGANTRCGWELTCSEPGVQVSARVTQLDVEAHFDTLSVSGAVALGSATNATDGGVVSQVAGGVVQLSGHSFERGDRVHEAFVFTSASAVDGLSLSFRSDGMRTGRGFVVEFACGSLDRCGVPGGDGSSCSIEVGGGWGSIEVAPFSAPRPFFFTVEAGEEYLITARELGGGGSVMSTSVVLHEWLAADALAGAQLAVTEDGCARGDPQLLWQANATGSVLVELEAGYAASGGRLAFRVDAHRPGECDAGSACLGCVGPAVVTAQDDAGSSSPAWLLASAVMLLVVSSAVCTFAFVTIRHKQTFADSTATDSADPTEKTSLLTMEEGGTGSDKVAATVDSDEEAEARATAKASALPQILPGAGPGKPPVAPLPLDLAPSAKFDNFGTTPTRGSTPKPAGLKQKRVEDSPPATVPSTPSPPIYAQRGRASPAELVLGPVMEDDAGEAPSPAPREFDPADEGAEQPGQGRRHA